MIRVRVHIMPVTDLLDAQGRAIVDALTGLGHKGVVDARSGRVIELVLATESREDAEASIWRMCEELLVNPVTESARLEFVAPDM